jgi:AcrR family transcriptional regulator
VSGSGIRRDPRERIETAAVRLFAQREFHRVGLDEIAREASASLQTIYKYYGSKEALLDACLHRWARELATRMADHLQGIETYKDRLRKVFWVVLDYFDRQPEVARMIQNTISADAVRRDVTDEQRTLTGLFLSVLRDGRTQGVLTDEVDERLLLDYFYGVLIRLIQMHIARGETQPLAAKANVLFDMLWRALAHPGAE